MSESHNFDWVTKRANCSLRAKFLTLKAQIAADVQARNKIDSQGGFQSAFRVVNQSADSFAVLYEVSLPASEKSNSVEFKIAQLLAGNPYISVVDGNEEILRANVTLSNEAECRFVVDGSELLDWQFRKAALEALFFGR